MIFAQGSAPGWTTISAIAHCIITGIRFETFSSSATANVCGRRKESGGDGRSWLPATPRPFLRLVTSSTKYCPKKARSEYHTQLAKMSFDEIFDLTAGVYFHFL